MANISSSDLPLAINMIGPMAFKQSGDTLEVWMPYLGNKKFPHQVGIGSNVTSIVLPGGQRDYSLSDPNPQKYGNATMPFNPPNGTSIPYTARATPPSSFYIHVSLPRPKWMIGLYPVSCEIYKGNPAKVYQLRPVGFRLLYEKAGAPVLTSSQGGKDYPVLFDPSPDEKQLEMFLSYAPLNSDDPNSSTTDHPEAKEDFHQLCAMLSLDLDIEFEYKMDAKFGTKNLKIFNGPLQNCKAANVTLG